MKNVLLVGSGGRESALAWKLSQSKEVGEIFVAPGNAGTSQIATNIPVDADNIPELLRFAKDKNIYLTIVGPDNAAAYSNSFISFVDVVEVLAATGIELIYSSSGSIGDEKVKEFCRENGIALALIPDVEGRGFYGH